ncbi:MAG: DsbA family protein [Sphingobacteriales bacterium]|nr:DsbA family protein [Sphingobacteriales bacterium]MBP9142050.1 DsbA family protein [Chitinophagales bacterium]MDA0198168.1 DsbA family protein [Bacteroidota bacterium]MBK6889616.1 DsbA family protein [Sphingobacteriales bacterium]MBK7527873.1 DsbA family protein [Sphingobacteriales bacterium]
MLQNKNTKNSSNPLLCDPDTGVCAIPYLTEKSQMTAEQNSNELLPASKPIRIIYFTDPICSSCWGIEAQLRKLKLQYGHLIHIEYCMGGLLPSWEVYNSGGISEPANVAQHWDEVALHYQMPIDGGVWLADPLPSSYPPSIAFKAAQLQNPDKALLFMRIIREMVFVEKKNITKLEHLLDAASKAKLNIEQFKADYTLGAAKQLFENDLHLAQKMGARGFPTLFFSNNFEEQVTVYGARPYETFEQAIFKLYPDAAAQPGSAQPLPDDLWKMYNSYTAKEWSLLTNSSFSAAEKQMDALMGIYNLEKITIKSGSLWRKKSINN